MARAVVLGTALLVGTAAPVLGQGSVFGVRGLGYQGRPVTGRNAGLGGALGALEPQGNTNPGALGYWGGLAGWGVGVPGARRFAGAGGDVEQRAMRFPLFGFATQLRPRVSVGLTIGDLLDRTWAVTLRDTVVLGSDTVPFDDLNESLGGVSDLRLAVGYRVSDRLSAGFGLHAFTGSTRLRVERNFESTSYADFTDRSQTDFSGIGVSAGVLVAGNRWTLGAALRLSGDLRARNSGGARADVPLPLEATLSGRYEAVPGVHLAGTLQHAGWARASDAVVATGLPAMRNTAAASAGLEVDRTNLLLVRAPVRLGYRWRQLPTQIEGAWLGERAVSAGIGLNFARGRAVVDAAYEIGSRRAGALRESFRTLYVGVTVRP
jgi:hypothetical protein